MKEILKFVNDQLSRWPLACANFRSLRNMERKYFPINGLDIVVSHNPARIVSSAAAVDSESIKKRKCFLCSVNRPSEQISLGFEGRKGRRYDILVNPYPIFQGHLVIAADSHMPQSIYRHYVDVLDFSREFTDYEVFYNGPECGASAPDHLHFQAAAKGQMPLLRAVDAALDKAAGHIGESVEHLEYLSSVRDAEVFHYQGFLKGIFVLRAETSKSIAKLFYRLIDCAQSPREGAEPLFNLFSWYSQGEYRSVVIFRSSHRSHHYFSQGPDHLTMSPGCADMAGYVIAPVKEEFDGLEPGLLADLLSEVALSEEVQDRIKERLTRRQEEVTVGIMSGQEIEFEIFADGAGRRKAVFKDGKVGYGGAVYDELFFEAKTPSTMFAGPSFMLYDVTIGVGFHWERKENQKFAGALRIVPGEDGLTAINVIGVEDYLISVISSEMKASASEEFLRAHAVISRSWLLSMIRRRTAISGSTVQDGVEYCQRGSASGGEAEFIRWYDRENHKDFDVCADDHCQRYQGLTRAVGTSVRSAVDATWGLVLTSGGEICDARFSKCCGGRTERFSSCWEDRDYDYLPSKVDEFCADVPREVLSQVLNEYDLETSDYYRWEVSYSIEELSELFARRTGLDVGRIQSIEALQRGESGRIVRLRVSGTNRTVVIGKELEIRRALSETHLKSSAFNAEFVGDHVILHGSGWGHGVGLCQIGAANMAAKGCNFRDILEYYYPGSKTEKL